ncbi:unnamed protein product [Mycena citricolor]|uniref:Uncharacterized protein n=1 Tax=Mycena citricolor TaxID=2018698 RepID=A0AAD2Q6X6_9AGAR|nr:unnamed protein product [Mycena citricolor]
MRSGLPVLGLSSKNLSISSQNCLFSAGLLGAYTPRIDSGLPSACCIFSIIARPGTTVSDSIVSTLARFLLMTNASPAALGDRGFSVNSIRNLRPNILLTLSLRSWFMCASPTTSTAIFCSLRICHIPSHLLSGWCTFRFPWPRMLRPATFSAVFIFFLTALCPFRGRSALGCVGGRVDWFLIGVSPLWYVAGHCPCVSLTFPPSAVPWSWDGVSL